MNLEETVRLFIHARDTIAAEEKAHKERMAPKKEALEKMKVALLGYLTQIGADNATVRGVGLIYKNQVNSVTVGDADQFMPWVKDGNRWDYMNISANKTAVVAYVQQHGEPPPGIKYSSYMDVGVRQS